MSECTIRNCLNGTKVKLANEIIENTTNFPLECKLGVLNTVLSKKEQLENAADHVASKSVDRCFSAM